ncbi:MULTISPECIES: universal stress protein [Gilliamella]|uniref:Universal stress protein n=1 Tax=Gilliamella apis TaxID=1970738 RepID=A0A242P3G1_9GAMM|nr:MULTISPECIES: universal stress protein [Gilliamella]KES14791.1 Universal stress protein UspA or related nucleotide-binding protein [Gilliamella apis SCGC AB-598-P17]MBI0060720.1 universal stress protein [Gilliamella sp. M0320]MBI0114952.1 universal stress protein [Gilliamella sp. W8123]MBI0118667.1 universal stress protein [Gilliamella sp. W8129]MBI0153602.1 universal stress protein [Gilliamella sp. W8128]
MYKKILVPIDVLEDELTQKVIPHVECLAKLSNAQVIFFHTLPVASAIVNAYSFGFDEFKDQATVQTEQWLHRLIDTINLPRENLSFSIAFGNPRDEILHIAEEIEPDLIILGSRRPNISTHLLGSNASGVVRGAQTSVLVVR